MPHNRIEEVNAFINAWQPTIKSLILVQGGSIIAVLALLGNIIGNNNIPSSEFVNAMTDAAKWMCSGLISTLIISTLVSLVADLDLSFNDLSQKFIDRVGFWLSIAAAIAIGISLWCLIEGVFSFLNSFKILSITVGK